MIIRFLYAGCGDAIHIRFEEKKGVFRNILIDGGTEKGDIYEKSLKCALQEIVDKKEHIDMWIITHIDDDHIGGILRLIKDEAMLSQLDLGQTFFWYNYSKWDYDTGIRTDQKKNVGQAIRLRDWLLSGSPVNQFITDSFVALDFWGARFSILSPDQKSMERLLKLWAQEETIIRQRAVSEKKTGSEKHDYKSKLIDFDLSKEFKDHSVENNSSIAFVLEYRGERFLFTADANHKVLMKSLERFGNGSKTVFKYVQVPHHGSKYNISDGLLSLIDCNEFIITGDGFNRSFLPNKFTLAKILKARENEQVIFHLTQKNALTSSLFAVDVEKEFDVRFPDKGEYFLEFKLGDPEWKQ